MSQLGQDPAPSKLASTAARQPTLRGDCLASWSAVALPCLLAGMPWRPRWGRPWLVGALPMGLPVGLRASTGLHGLLSCISTAWWVDGNISAARYDGTPRTSRLGSARRNVHRSGGSCPHPAPAGRLARRCIGCSILLVRAGKLLGKGMQQPKEGFAVCQRGLLGVDEAAQMPAQKVSWGGKEGKRTQRENVGEQANRFGAAFAPSLNKGGGERAAHNRSPPECCLGIIQSLQMPSQAIHDARAKGAQLSQSGPIGAALHSCSQSLFQPPADMTGRQQREEQRSVSRPAWMNPAKSQRQVQDIQ